MNKFVIFGQNKSLFALDLISVREVLFFEREVITPVANSEPFLMGLTNLRGEIIAIIDFGGFIGIQTVDRDSPDCRILVVEAPDPSDARLSPMRMGLAVSFVEGVLILDGSRIVSPLDVSEELAPLLRGLYDDRGRLLMIVDIEAISLGVRSANGK